MRLDHLLSKELTIFGCPLLPRVLAGGLLMGGISTNTIIVAHPLWGGWWLGWCPVWLLVLVRLLPLGVWVGTLLGGGSGSGFGALLGFEATSPPSPPWGVAPLVGVPLVWGVVFLGVVPVCGAV